MAWYQHVGEVVTVHVYVQPGAKCTGIVGLHGDALKIRLNAPPIDGRANEALIKYMAELFDVPARQVTLVCGDKSRKKTLRITKSVVDPASLGAWSK